MRSFNEKHAKKATPQFFKKMSSDGVGSSQKQEKNAFRAFLQSIFGDALSYFGVLTRFGIFAPTRGGSASPSNVFAAISESQAFRWCHSRKSGWLYEEVERSPDVSRGAPALKAAHSSVFSKQLRYNLGTKTFEGARPENSYRARFIHLADETRNFVKGT